MITNAQLKAMLEQKIANYHRLIKEYHPDKNDATAQSLMARINLCQEILREIG